MTVSRRHLVALIGAALTSAVALSDAVVRGATGHSLLSSDNAGPVAWILAVDLVHGLTYAALSWVLVGERHRVRRTSRFVRALHHALVASMSVLAAGFVLVDPVVRIAHLPSDAPLAAAWGWIGGIGFAGMILSCLLLGIAVLRSNPLGYGGRVLGLLVPVLVATVLLGLVGSDWAHPAYAETVIYVGVALLGIGAPAARTEAADGPDTRQQPGEHPTARDAELKPEN